VSAERPGLVSGLLRAQVELEAALLPHGDEALVLRAGCRRVVFVPSGDVIRVDLATPVGSEAGMVRPAVIVTAQRVLEHAPRVLQVVPVTTTLRGWTSEATIPADAGGGLVLQQIRETLATLLDL
jgi:mRNA-degrading endonuclease toxin of MazEF toxin-antitoxin module